MSRRKIFNSDADRLQFYLAIKEPGGEAMSLKRFLEADVGAPPCEESCGLMREVVMENAPIPLQPGFLVKFIDALGYRERRVLEFRCGFHGRALTHEEVAREFGVTRDRIRQIEAKAIRKILGAFSKSTRDAKTGRR